MKRAVVLLSGGVDSTTCAYLAISGGYEVLALSFDYGQRLRRELLAAKRVATKIGVREHQILSFDLSVFGGSALTADIPLPEGRDAQTIGQDIPITYVPGRNTIFLAFGLAYAECREAEALFIGVNALDSSGYPDCRPEYIAAFQLLADLGTRRGVQGRTIQLETPLLHLSKAGVIRRGHDAGVDYSMTWSCYGGGDRPCERCDACVLRAKGFAEARMVDPLLAISPVIPLRGPGADLRL